MKTVYAIGAALAVGIASAAGVASAQQEATVETAPMTLDSPALAECYTEGLPVKADATATFVPDEMTVFSLIPEGTNDVEFVIEADDDISDEEIAAALDSLQNSLSEYARKFLGTKYVWGAKGPKAFDCSGFTGYVFRNFGYDIGPSSRVQATRGEKVDLKEARVGDLMFFSRPGGGKTVGHVGMVIDVNPDDGSLKFIHASSRKGVTIQNFPDTGHYNRRFLQVRRVIDDKELAMKS